MQTPDLERAARVVAENVASAVEREQEGPSHHPLIREALMVELLRALLPVMPLQSSAALVEALQSLRRLLRRFPGGGGRATVRGGRPGDGSVTMRRG